MNYQGTRTDAGGHPVTTPAGQPESIALTVYNAPTAGNALWTETQGVPVSEGLFSVQLGASNPLPSSLFTGAAAYLVAGTLKVAGQNSGFGGMFQVDPSPGEDCHKFVLATRPKSPYI